MIVVYKQVGSGFRIERCDKIVLGSDIITLRKRNDLRANGWDSISLETKVLEQFEAIGEKENE